MLDRLESSVESGDASDVSERILDVSGHIVGFLDMIDAKDPREAVLEDLFGVSRVLFDMAKRTGDRSMFRMVKDLENAADLFRESADGRDLNKVFRRIFDKNFDASGVKDVDGLIDDVRVSRILRVGPVIKSALASRELWAAYIVYMLAHLVNLLDGDVSRKELDAVFSVVDAVRQYMYNV